jgi:hypothetical protein
LPNSDVPLYSSSDHGDDHDHDDDDDINTHALRQHFHSKHGGCKFSFTFDGNEGDGDSGDDDDDEPDDDNDDNDDDLDNVSKATLSLFASSGDSSSLLPALLVETIFIWPFQPPILSNRLVTEMLLVPVTRCNNVFLLLTLPHL